MAWLLLALAAAGFTARLGWWQLDRAAQKTAIADAMRARAAMPPLPLQDLARTDVPAAAQAYRHIRLRGRWLPEFTVYLDNRPMAGRTGFIVLTPLLLGPADAVLVQRGWLPRDQLDRTKVAAPALPKGEVELEGQVAPLPSRLLEFAAEPTGLIRQNLDLPPYAKEVGVPFRPLSVWALDDSPGLLRQWPAPVVDVSKHHGYAFQWFALSALITGLYVWFQIIQPRRTQRRHAPDRA